MEEGKGFAMGRTKERSINHVIHDELIPEKRLAGQGTMTKMTLCRAEAEKTSSLR